MTGVLRKWLGTARFYPENSSHDEATVSAVNEELEAVRQNVRQRLQRIESKDRVFDLYAGKMRLMRGDGE